MQPSDLARQFQDFSAATVYEAAGKLGDMEPNIRPIVPGLRMMGPAFTVKCFVGDDLRRVAFDLRWPLRTQELWVVI